MELQAAFQRRVDDITARLARFDTLRQEGRYYEAASTLRDIAASDDTRLQTLLAQVEERSCDLTGERAARSDEVAANFAQAQHALATCDFAEALKILERIPAGFRDRPILDALKAATDALEETRSLEEQIRDALRADAVDDLLPRVNRLLELRPNDVRFKQLSEQLQQRQLRRGRATAEQRLVAAKKLFLEGQCAKAAELIRTIPDEHIVPEQRKLYDIVLEVDGVVRWLKQEPWVHPGLIGLAERWQKLRPHDPEAEKTIDKLRKRSVARGADPRFALAWAPFPESSSIGIPVQWWRGLAHIEASDDAAAFHQDASRFLVAYGLALQGLGLAALPLNLLRPRQRAMWQKLSELRSGAPPRTVWGCDLSGGGLKAVQLSRDKQSGQLRIDRAVYLPHSGSMTDPADEQALITMLQATMETFVEEHASEPSPIVLGFAGPRSLGRTFEIPRFQGKRAADAIAYEARRQIPIPAEEIAFDWFAWPEETDRSRLQSVTLLAGRRDHLQPLVTACAALPHKLLAIQSDCLALYNAVANQYFGRTSSPRADDDIESPDGSTNRTERSSELPSGPTLAILDIGESCSSLIIASPHLVRYRSFHWGMQRLDRALMSKFHVTAIQARRLRHQPTSARWMYQLANTMDEALGELTDDLSRTLRVYAAEGIQADRLLVTGGGSNQLGLFRRLAHPR